MCLWKSGPMKMDRGLKNDLWDLGLMGRFINEILGNRGVNLLLGSSCTLEFIMVAIMPQKLL